MIPGYISLINSYLAFSFLHFSMTKFLQYIKPSGGLAGAGGGGWLAARSGIEFI